MTASSLQAGVAPRPARARARARRRGRRRARPGRLSAPRVSARTSTSRKPRFCVEGAELVGQVRRRAVGLRVETERAVERARVVVLVALEARHLSAGRVSMRTRRGRAPAGRRARPPRPGRGDTSALAPALGVQGLLEGQVGRVERRLVGAVARARRRTVLAIGRTWSRVGAEDVEAAIVDEARGARLHVDQDEGARRVVGAARLDGRRCADG